MNSNKLVYRIMLGVGLLLIASAILYLAWPDSVCGVPESRKTYEYPEEDITIIAWESVSEEIITAAHDYIIANGYNAPEMKYIFINSLTRIDYPHLFDNHESIERAYHVVECYKDAFTQGGFWLNREGETVDDEGYVEPDELAEVNTEIMIGKDAARKIAKEVSTRPDETLYYNFGYRRDEQGTLIYCYEFVFHDYTVCVDVHNGNIIDRVPMVK